MPNIVRVSPTAVVLRSRSHMYGLTNFPTQTRDTIYVLPVVLFCTIAVASQEVTDIAAKDDDLCYPCLVNGEGICLVWALRCDGIDHCDKGSDEDFDLCYGDSCLAVLPDFRRCDGKKDCRDGRDEYYDGCHDDEATSSSSVFGNASVAVAASFLIGVVVVITWLYFLYMLLLSEKP
ncbi:uncharacterized protein LOC100375300 [Saccoglossus kowalevskii]|uniref:Uncharacterized protein LOC100375300 n=1 Tax=Saccoglossus kowalevskii TaxID=10224 RepID=A0ABM0H0L6_SACKO|nr:PREDICTED: uncharacterized protein LOC100375300 [Saccoglossus kowalevskii]